MEPHNIANSITSKMQLKSQQLHFGQLHNQQQLHPPLNHQGQQQLHYHHQLIQH
jgi:hypothetical protein